MTKSNDQLKEKEKLENATTKRIEITDHTGKAKETNLKK